MKSGIKLGTIIDLVSMFYVLLIGCFFLFKTDFVLFFLFTISFLVFDVSFISKVSDFGDAFVSRKIKVAHQLSLSCEIHQLHLLVEFK